MQKTMITVATVFALVMSAGASMAAPLGDHGFGGRAHDVRSNVSQVFDHQNANMSDRSFELSSKQSLGGRNRATSQQTDLYGSNDTEYDLDIYVDSDAIKTLKDSGDDLWVFPSVKSY
ncbi:MAG: hypothetical protein AAFX90_13650 [Pseudomonadota bacterium]